jgi:hypothetical protein
VVEEESSAVIGCNNFSTDAAITFYGLGACCDNALLCGQYFDTVSTGDFERYLSRTTGFVSSNWVSDDVAGSLRRAGYGKSLSVDCGACW